ncbi:MAG TPA: thiamine-phosphate kinase [Nitrospirae bacterium]|nr:thiamine-phosphate kinase [Nitrospirota bacterium]
MSLLQKIRKKFQIKRDEVLKSIGDDCAVIKGLNKPILVTTDSLNEGVHFDRSYTSAYTLGFKTVSVNISDIFATGGQPLAIFLSLSFPKDTEETFFWDFYEGIEYALKIYKLDLLGGDLCESLRNISICATVIGFSDKPVYRNGAKVGDLICVTGSLGDSSLGFKILNSLDENYKYLFSKIKKNKNIDDKEVYILKEGKKISLNTQSIMPFVNRHLMPIARNSKEISPIATSMIDISDGLFIDLFRVCDESKVGAMIFTQKLPILKEMKGLAEILREDPLKLATTGGEDFELLFTIPKGSFLPEKTDYEITVIGEVIPEGLYLVDDKGQKSRIQPKGYEHFSAKFLQNRKHLSHRITEII